MQKKIASEKYAVLPEYNAANEKLVTGESEFLAEDFIRQRRSAQRMMLGVGISSTEFYRIISRTLPFYNRVPFDSFPCEPAANLLIFVH